MPATIGHVKKVLDYLKEKGEQETLNFFNIKKDTLERYKRRLKHHGDAPIVVKTTRIPKVLLLDIETTPMIATVWGTWKQRIDHEQVQQDWFMLSYSAKWLFEAEMFSSVLTPAEVLAKDDKRIATELWALVDKADVISGHNIKGFDLPKMQTRWILNGLPPVSPFQLIDTLDVARKNFRFASNKLDYIGQLIRNEGKIHTEYQLWLRCLKGDPKSLNEMLVYNEGDVRLLEDAFVFLRPYFKSAPNMAIYQESTEPSCPTCGSTNIQDCGHYVTSVNRFLAFRCLDCGAICRSRSTDVTVKQKRGILAPTAR